MFEVVGTLTHKIPENKQGIAIDLQKDAAGEEKAQFMVVEYGTIPITALDFKVSLEKTIYLQEDAHTFTVIKNIPNSSVLNQSTEKSKIITNMDNIPKDEGF